MMKVINFDMDGTLADFYGVENWLDSLKKEHTKPYRIARPLVNMRKLSKELNRLQGKGYIINILSWLPKNGSYCYNMRVATAKVKWLKKHIGSFEFNNIYILEYITPKYLYSNGLLFDDEVKNRIAWNSHSGNLAFGVGNILDILKALQ